MSTGHIEANAMAPPASHIPLAQVLLGTRHERRRYFTPARQALAGLSVLSAVTGSLMLATGNSPALGLAACLGGWIAALWVLTGAPRVALREQKRKRLWSHLVGSLTIQEPTQRRREQAHGRALEAGDLARLFRAGRFAELDDVLSHVRQRSVALEYLLDAPAWVRDKHGHADIAKTLAYGHGTHTHADALFIPTSTLREQTRGRWLEAMDMQRRILHGTLETLPDTLQHIHQQHANFKRLRKCRYWLVDGNQDVELSRTLRFDALQ